MSNESQNRARATWEEKKFISNIGTHRLKGATATRKDLLRGYAEGIKNRNWDGLNKAAIIAHLHVAMVDAGLDPAREPAKKKIRRWA